VGATPALLVSLHDVSPLTLDDCRRAIELFEEVGLAARHLTCLLIPFHEGRVAIDQDPATLDVVRGLAAGGATLVMHGFTHRMVGRAWRPHGILRAHLFARGQGELFRCDAADAEQRLAQGQRILRRAGLEQALRGFVPPAWLVSRGARAAIERAGFLFVERRDGIVHAGRRRAHRVIRWGSLGALEARATAVHAAWLARRADTDTRLAVHPADIRRPRQRREVRRLLERLLARMRPASYDDYLGLLS